MTLTERIDAIIKERGLSRRKVAILAQIPPSTFQSAMERNKNMSVDMLEKVAQALDISLSDLYYSTTAQQALFSHMQSNPSTPTGERIRILFDASDFDPMIVCYNLDIDQGYLNSWIELGDLPPRPIVDKILAVFHLQASQVLSDADFRIYNEESSERGSSLIYDSNGIDDKTLSQKQLLTAFGHLNQEGQQRAIERVEELTEIPKYKK